MKSLYLELTLLSDVAVSERSATIGGHLALPYIPGSTLLGACAANGGYAAANERAWAVFHSGAVRFGDALPAGNDGAPALPMPLSLHLPKQEARGGTAPSAASNRARGNLGTPVQWVQLRKNFMASNLAEVRTGQRQSLRTAVTEEGRARDGLLFGISALPSGTVLRSRVDVDDDAVLAFVRERLVGRELRIGRSRGTEFGRVRVEQVAAWREPTSGSPKPGTALFYCVSDLYLLDSATGQASVVPSSNAFGLPEKWLFNSERSFIRTRRYTPFNGARGLPDTERQVVVAGSVLMFEGAGVPDPRAVALAINAGVGLARAEGLGRVLFEPGFLSGERPIAWGVETPAGAPRPAARPTGALLAWAEARASESLERDRAHDLAESWLRLPSLEDAAKLPPAQWGQVRAIARLHRGAASTLLKQLHAFTGVGVAQTGQRDERPYPRTSGVEGGGRSTRHLKSRWGRERDGATLGERLTAVVAAAPVGVDAALALEIFAARVVRKRRREEEKRGDGAWEVMG